MILLGEIHFLLAARNKPRKGLEEVEIFVYSHVGYAQNGLQNGATLVTPQFLGINTTGGVVDLQSIKCSDGSSDLVFAQTVDSIGLTVDMYGWVDYGGDNGDELCWLDMNTMEKAEGVTIAPGQALWVQGDSEENILTSAGKVGTADVAVQLKNGATLAGNPTPVAIDLQDIVCSDGCSDLVFMQTVDEIGLTVDMYGWVDYGGDNGDELCWLDMNTMEKDEGVTNPQRHRLLVHGGNEDTNMNFTPVGV